MSRTCPSGFGPGTPAWFRQFAAAIRIAPICASVSALGWRFGLRNGEVPATGLRDHRVVPRREPKQQVEQGSRLPSPRGGDGALRLEEPLDPSGSDLRKYVVLERGKDVEADLVAVVLLGSFSEWPEVEISQPNLDQVNEMALRRENAGAAERGAVQQPFLENQPCLGRGPCGDPDMSHPAVGVTNPGLGDSSITSAANSDRAVGADGGTRPCHQLLLSWWRRSSSPSNRVSQASISLTRKRSSRPTRNPRGPRPWLRRS